MPYGPGKFEGEGFETFTLYLASLDSWHDEECGNVELSIGWNALFRGPIAELPSEAVTEGLAAGYTTDEVIEGIRVLGLMRGAILTESALGFITAYCYGEGENFERDWQELLDIEAESFEDQ